MADDLSLKRPEKTNSDFVYDDKKGLGQTEKAAFDTNGYVALRGLLSSEEVNKLKSALEHKDGVMSHMYHTQDAEQRKLTTAHWAQPGSDVTGVVARSEKIVQAIETLLGGDVYHYYAKVICKEPKTGGSLHWHQDYGYWYHNGLMFPDVGTLWIAIDKSTKENGCIQLLSGSHMLGRIDHRRVESKKTTSSGVQDQTVADPARVELAKKYFTLIYGEAEPGDAFFFNSNVLHRSDANESTARRMAHLIMYNRCDNDPEYKHQWSNYTPIHKVPNSAILACDNFSNLKGKEFMDLKKEYRTGSAQKELSPDMSTEEITRSEQKHA